MVAYALQVLEMGIIVHSVVIGLGIGASPSVCTIRPLVAAMCFHQLFEGMGLGGCILQAEYGLRMRAGLVFFFSTTTPFGIALGLALTRVYRENSPTALVVVGLLNAASAGLLHYMALVELLAADFMGPRLQGSVRLQLLSFAAVLLGAGGPLLLGVLLRPRGAPPVAVHPEPALTGLVLPLIKAAMALYGRRTGAAARESAAPLRDDGDADAGRHGRLARWCAFSAWPSRETSR